MTDIIKKVSRVVPTTQRTQVFTEADASAGDVILVQDSLGKSASHVLIDATDAMSIRPNVYHTIYPMRDGIDDLNAWMPGFPNLTSGVQVKNNEGVTFNIEAGSTLEFNNEIQVNDIELLTVSGVFEIQVS